MSLPRPKPITDAVAIHAVITDPWVAARVRHDHREPAYVDHPDVEYLGCYVGKELAGVFMLIHDFVEITIHAYIKRAFVRHGREWGRAVIEHAFNYPNVLRISAPILATLPSAVNYCRKLGFRFEGYQPDSVVIGGKPVGAYLLGLTRAQWRQAQ